MCQMSTINIIKIIRHLVEGFLEAIYLDIVEACVKILNKYESLFILALPYEKDKSD